MSEMVRLQGPTENRTIDDDRVWISSAITRFQASLVRYACMFVRDEDVACDIVQETFLKLCRMETPLKDDHLRSWLFQVCRNGAIDFCRKEKRMMTGQVEFEDTVENRETSPEETIQQQETIATVQQQMQTLSLNQQEVLRLKFQSGFSYQQIAELTGLTKSNVGVLLHTAINKLKSKLGHRESF